ncbi:MAG: EamA family transporter [Anaerolineales bacterium]|nr:EamA family transporter [Anaerolineales bacterium]
MEEKKKITPAGLINLFIVYFVWGSTYLAIRIGIRSGSGFQPFWFGGLRVLVAGTILLLLGVIRGKDIRPNKKDLKVLIASGFLLWIGGNGLVVLAEQRIDSGIAALVVASTPIWVALFESILDKRMPSLLLIGSLIVGFGGIIVLSLPLLTSGVRADILSILAVMLASFSWSAGLVLQTRQPVSLSRGVSSAYQQLFGGVFFALITLLVREPLPTPTTEAWLAWGYLVLFGSIIAFTAFVSALQQLPTSLVTTYAYVNPVIAVLLGWLILREPITPWTIIGGLFVMIGVTGIFRVNNKKAHLGQESSAGEKQREG